MKHYHHLKILCERRSDTLRYVGVSVESLIDRGGRDKQGGEPA